MLSQQNTTSTQQTSYTYSWNNRDFELEPHQMPDSILGNFKCSLCLNILNKAHAICEQQHSVCHGCLEKFKEYNFTKCSMCNGELLKRFVENKTANRVIGDLGVTCTNKDNGCQSRMKISDIECHMQNCLHETANKQKAVPLPSARVHNAPTLPLNEPMEPIFDECACAKALCSGGVYRVPGRNNIFFVLLNSLPPVQVSNITCKPNGVAKKVAFDTDRNLEKVSSLQVRLCYDKDTKSKDGKTAIYFHFDYNLIAKNASCTIYSGSEQAKVITESFKPNASYDTFPRFIEPYRDNKVLIKLEIQ